MGARVSSNALHEFEAALSGAVTSPNALRANSERRTSKARSHSSRPEDRACRLVVGRLERCRALSRLAVGPPSHQSRWHVDWCWIWRAVLAGERVVCVSNMVHGRIRMLLCDCINRRVRVAAQANPAGRALAMDDCAVQRILERAAKICFSPHRFNPTSANSGWPLPQQYLTQTSTSSDTRPVDWAGRQEHGC